MLGEWALYGKYRRLLRILIPLCRPKIRPVCCCAGCIPHHCVRMVRIETPVINDMLELEPNVSLKTHEQQSNTTAGKIFDSGFILGFYHSSAIGNSASNDPVLRVLTPCPDRFSSRVRPADMGMNRTAPGACVAPWVCIVVEIIR